MCFENKNEMRCPLLKKVFGRPKRVTDKALSIVARYETLDRGEPFLTTLSGRLRQLDMDPPRFEAAAPRGRDARDGRGRRTRGAGRLTKTPSYCATSSTSTCGGSPSRGWPSVGFRWPPPRRIWIARRRTRGWVSGITPARTRRKPFTFTTKLPLVSSTKHTIPSLTPTSI